MRESEENIAQDLLKLPILIFSSVECWGQVNLSLSVLERQTNLIRVHHEELKAPVKNNSYSSIDLDFRAILTIFCALLAGSSINLN